MVLVGGVVVDPGLVVEGIGLLLEVLIVDVENVVPVRVNEAEVDGTPLDIELDTMTWSG